MFFATWITRGSSFTNGFQSFRAFLAKKSLQTRAKHPHTARSTNARPGSTIPQTAEPSAQTNIKSADLSTVDSVLGLPLLATSDDSTNVSPSTTPEKDLVSATGGSETDLLGLGLLDEVSKLLALLPLWQTVGEGEPLTLSIGINVLNLVSLQWYFNGQPITGANKGSLLIPSVRSAQVGRYQLRATLLGITLVSIPTDVQINATDATVDRSVAAFDKLTDSGKLSSSAKIAKSGSVSHGYSGSQTFSTISATRDPGEPVHCGVNTGASEWYAWQTPMDGTAVIDTDGSTFDTVLAIYIGPGNSYSTLTNVACDNNSGSNGKTSRVIFGAKSGMTYYIAVAGVNGASGTVKLNYTVGTPASITAQPVSRTAMLGSSATLNVNATGFPVPCFQWMLNGTNIPSATNALLALNGITPNNFGSYCVRVTNRFNVLMSGVASVTLAPPLGFSPPRRQSGGVLLALAGPAGTNYAIEYSTDLIAWSPIVTNYTQTGLAEYIDSAGTNSCRFYRARAVP